MSGARGETTIVCGDTEYHILFTNRALADAERAMGKSVITAARTFSEGGLGLGDVAQLLLAGIQAARRDARSAGPPCTLNEVYRIMDTVGFGRVAQAVMTAVAAVLTYDGEEAGETTNPPE